MDKLIYKLNTNWFIDKDPENEGAEIGWNEHISNTAVAAYVPSVIQQIFPEYHGAAFYWCPFTPDITVPKNGRTFLSFGGVDYKAVVWLNGEYLGEYEGGETPFSFDVTEKLKLNAENLLAVKVINPAGSNIDGLNIVNIPSKNKSVTKSAGRSLNSGGIWYEVWVVSLPGVYLENELLTGDINSGRLSASLNIKNTLAFSVKATLQLNIYEKTGGC